MSKGRPLSIKTVENVRTRLWPDFVARDGCIFVAFQIGDSTTGPPSGTKTEWECFVNHTHILDEFRSSAYEEPDMEGVPLYTEVPLKVHEDHPEFLLVKQLGETMACTWATKLKQDFPADRFRVYYLHYDLACLTFYKVRPEDAWLTDEEFLTKPEECFRDGILYDTGYLDRPVRRTDSDLTPTPETRNIGNGVLQGQSGITEDLEEPLPSVKLVGTKKDWLQ